MPISQPLIRSPNIFLSFTFFISHQRKKIVQNRTKAERAETNKVQSRCFSNPFVFLQKKSASPMKNPPRWGSWPVRIVMPISMPAKRPSPMIRFLAERLKYPRILLTALQTALIILDALQVFFFGIKTTLSGQFADSLVKTAAILGCPLLSPGKIAQQPFGGLS